MSFNNNQGKSTQSQKNFFYQKNYPQSIDTDNYPQSIDTDVNV